MGNFQKPAARTFKFATIGTTLVGKVKGVTQELQLAFTEDNRPNGPRFDENGQPVYGTTVTLDSLDAKGEVIGEVKLRIGDSIFTDKGREVARVTSGLAVAIADALEAADAADLSVGDTLTISYVGDEPSELGDRNPAKIYDASITVAE